MTFSFGPTGWTAGLDVGGRVDGAPVDARRGRHESANPALAGAPGRVSGCPSARDSSATVGARR